MNDYEFEQMRREEREEERESESIARAFSGVSSRREKPEENTKGLHSEIHTLAKDISTFCGEPKKFAMYLGAIKRRGKEWGYTVFSELKQGRNLKNPAALFFWKSRQKLSTPPVASNQAA